MDIITILSSLISLILITLFIFVLYPDYRTDLFRHKMFRLRDSLFNEVLAGKIAFTDPAYGMLRDTMNGFIRFANKMTIWQYLLLPLIINRNRDKNIDLFKRQFEDKTIDCTNDQKDLYSNYYKEMDYLILDHLIFSSMLLHTLLLPVKMFIAAKTLSDLLINKLKLDTSIDKFNSIALNTGKH